MITLDDFKNQDEEDVFEDMEDEEFQDFEESEGTLGDLWRNSPLLKLGVVFGGVIIVVVALIILGGGKEEIVSDVGRGMDRNQLPGEAELSPDMQGRIIESNEQDFRQQEAIGGSSVPISTQTPTTNDFGDDQGEGDTLEDPLDVWRNQSLDETIREDKQEPQPIEAEPIVAVQPQPVMPQPDPEMIGNLAGLMAAQMQQILAGHAIQPPRHMTVTAETFLDDNNGSGNGFAGDNGGGSDEEDESLDPPMRTLVPAGTVVYAQTLTEANTDAPGPVLAQILNGKLKGSRILGTFDETEVFLIIRFDQVVVDGESIGVNGIALDTETTLTGVATDIDRRYIRRVVLPAAAAFIEGLGSAIADTGSTNVTVNGETVTTEQDDLDTREELFKGVEAASEELGGFMREEGDRIRPMIKVAAGTPIGILFTAPVMQAENE
jgi:intracellular multiplication protein IcmE